MKTVLMSSTFALMLAPAALADQMTVIDFNQDGIIGEADYIGPKSVVLDTLIAPATTQTVTHTTMARDSVNVVPVSQLAPTGDNYVDIGVYRGGTTGTLQAMPATTRTVTEIRQVAPVSAAAALGGTFYKADAIVDNSITAAEMGFGQDQFVNNNLAAYDTNKDGKVTVSEAVANVDPSTDPNVAAVYGLRTGTLEEFTTDSDLFTN